MRCKNIQIKMSMPIRVNQPDLNGTVYTEEALRNAYDNCKNVPIISYDKNGEETIVGVVKNAVYNDGIVEVDGICLHGGTCEKVQFDDEKRISQMEITSFGITK